MTLLNIFDLSKIFVKKKFNFLSFQLLLNIIQIIF